MRWTILGGSLAFVVCASSVPVWAAPPGKRGGAQPKNASPAAVAPATTPVSPAPAAPPAPLRPSLAETLTGDAKSEYEGGKLLYGDGDFAGALVKFQRAYELASEPRLLWNMAACEKNLRHYTKVLTLVLRYQKDGAALLTEEDRQQAADLTQAVSAFVSKLRITVNEAGAQVFVDDEAVGTTPMAEPALIDMGMRRVRIKKDGFKDFDDPQQVSGGGEVSLSVNLEKEVHQGRLYVSAGEKDAIAIDGQVVATGKWEGVVPSGGHTLRVTAPGMRSYQSELSIRDNEVRSVPVTLDPEARQGGSAWPWIAGGAAVVAGAAVGGYFLFKPKDQAAPPPVAGTLDPGTVQLKFWGVR